MNMKFMQRTISHWVAPRDRCKHFKTKPIFGDPCLAAMMEEMLWEALSTDALGSNVSCFDDRPLLRSSCLVPGLASSSRQVLDSALKAGHRKEWLGPFVCFLPLSHV